MRIASVLITVSLATPTVAGDFSLAFPVDCTLGQDCYIQQYTDVDPSDQARDFTCGTLVYNGHKGTDIALPSLADLHSDVQVLAAADGTVKGSRNSVPDALLGSAGAPNIQGRECGNGLIIDHGDGWETQYCHLRQGSVRVKTGQTVTAGTPLGLVGLSGKTEFPHLHMSVRHNGQVIDPFAPNANATCGRPVGETLWQTPPVYKPGGWIRAGFSPGIPEFTDIKAGTAQTQITKDPVAIVVWGFGYGTRQGDEVRIDIKGPTRMIHSRTVTLDRGQAQMFRASGLRRPSNGWDTGPYVGTVTLIRDGVEIDQIQREIELP